METIKEYIAQYEGKQREALEEIYAFVKTLVPPETTERMSWQMPTFYLKGNLVHFAVHKSHLGFYPGENGVKVFEEELTQYRHSKGAIQFPLDKSLPKELIEKIVKFRIAENLQ